MRLWKDHQSKHLVVTMGTFLTAVEMADCMSSLWVTHLVGSLLAGVTLSFCFTVHVMCHTW